jgi:transposase-like protein
MATNWTDELKESVISAYTQADPTPETSMDIVVSIAKEYDVTPNGVRMILSKEGVYVKKTPAPKAKSVKAESEDKPKTTRVNKAVVIEELSALIKENGHPVDSEILDKLTGKAAQYFLNILKA